MDEEQASMSLAEDLAPPETENGMLEAMEGLAVNGTPQSSAEQWKQTLEKVAKAVVVLKVVSCLLRRRISRQLPPPPHLTKVLNFPHNADPGQSF